MSLPLHDADAARQDWQATVIAIDLALAAPGSLGGVVLSGRHGPVRDALLARIARHHRIERLAAGSADEALEQGLDVAGTLGAGRAVRRRTVLERLDADPGAVLLIIGAERLSTRAGSRLARWLDDGDRRVPVVALDEGDESSPDAPAFIESALGERLAMHVRLPELTLAELQAHSGEALLGGALLPAPDDALAAAGDERYGAANGPSNRTPRHPAAPDRPEPRPDVPDERIRELVHLAHALGIRSARAPVAALAATRELASLNGHSPATLDDSALAARLVLAPRAAQRPDAEPAPADPGEEHAEADPANDPASDPASDPANASVAEPSAEPETAQRPETDTPAPTGEHDPDPSVREDTPASDADAPAPMNEPSAQALPERLVAAVSAALPPNLLGSLASDLGRTGRTPGRRGNGATRAVRGRPAGVTRPRSGDHGRRLDIVATLKAAVPWQRLRTPTDGPAAGSTSGQARLAVRPSDFRVRRHVQPLRTTTVFIVDASGSAAMHRIGEAKGALEAVLAECYVRRDRVALISFRGAGATLELPPTRSLARARRALVGLAAGGGTPIAAGLDLASDVLDDIVRNGERAVGIIMSDGRANVARNGLGGRPAAQADAEHAAERLAGVGARLLFVDTAPRPRPIAAQLAARMRARYLPLPSRGGAQALPGLLAAAAPDAGRAPA